MKLNLSGEKMECNVETYRLGGRYLPCYIQNNGREQRATRHNPKLEKK